MKSPLHWLAAASITVISGISFGQTVHYVSPTGTDAANNCQTPGSPCGTLDYAYTQLTAGDTLKLAPGNYSLTSTLNLLQSVVITALDATNKPVITSTASDVILVNSNDVTISNLKFEMGLTATTGLKGIVSNASFDNINIVDNDFKSVKPLTTGMAFGAYAIQLNSVVGDIQNATITGNHIWADLVTSDMFGRGLGLGNSTTDGPGADISDNDIRAYYPIQAVRNADDLNVSDNDLNGIIMVNYPLTDVVVTIEGNTISGNTQLTPANLYALLDIRSIEVGSVEINNNVISDFQNIGVLSMASVNVSINDNTFSPFASATNFVAIMANTKLMTNGVQGNTFSDEIEILGNTFNAGIVGNGTAILFADHYGANTPAFNDITVGGALAAEKNVFAAGLGKYIALDAQTGPSTAFALWSTYPATTMVPFSQDVEALIANNTYNQTTISAIEGKNNDELDNAVLGKVMLTDGGDNRYVATTGSDAANDCTLPGFPCATFARAITVAVDADSIIVSAGNYALTSILTVTQDELTITAANSANAPVITTNQTTVFDINAEDVTINALRMELGLTATSGKYGVVSTANNFDGLTVKNSEILSSSPVIPYGMVWDAFAIRLNAGSTLQAVTIEDNTIGTVTPTGNNIFGRGITLGSGSVAGPGATITGNEVMAYYTVQAISSVSNVAITANDFNGILMLNAPANGVALTVVDNSFDAVTPMTADSLYALVEVRSIENGTALISDNDFSNYTRLALLSEASKNVTVSSNDFAPATTADDFVSLMVNTKLMTNGTQGNTYADEIVIKGNNFDAGATDGGTAIIFADHYGVNTPAFGTITIGGAAANDKNEFNTNLGNYIVLDDKTGASTTYPLWAGYSVTTMKPVTQNVEALVVNNIYNYVYTAEVEEKNIDSVDNVILGKVVLAYSFVGLNEVATQVASLYPNPANANVTIELTDATASASLTIVDLLGNVVYSSTINGVASVDVSKLNAGVYVVQLNNNGQASSTRFVKN